ncbi:MAG: hypothetical protein ACPGXW_08385 [Synechococcus sp.]
MNRPGSAELPAAPAPPDLLSRLLQDSGALSEQELLESAIP